MRVETKNRIVESLFVCGGLVGIGYGVINRDANFLTLGLIVEASSLSALGYNIIQNKGSKRK